LFVPQEPKQKRDEEESDYDPGWILSPPMMVRHVPLAMPNFEFTEHLPRNKKGDPFSESPWVFLMFLGCGTEEDCHHSYCCSIPETPYVRPLLRYECGSTG
jgi:hypothetical protein